MFTMSDFLSRPVMKPASPIAACTAGKQTVNSLSSQFPACQCDVPGDCRDKALAWLALLFFVHCCGTCLPCRPRCGSQSQASIG